MNAHIHILHQNNALEDKMLIRGPVAIDKRTKDLAKRIKPGEIAIIDHIDIDEVAANSLVAAKIKAVINMSKSISGKYPNSGPQILNDNGITIIEIQEKNFLDKIKETELIEIDFDGKIYKENKLIAEGIVLEKKIIESQMMMAHENLSQELDKFIDNTIEYAKKEKGMILGDFKIPNLKTEFENRHVLIVVRGKNYKEDLLTIKSYIDEVKPIMIGVDGGGDALLEFGLTPDIIVGDMDSVSDLCLKKAKEIVVHAYQDGKAPGLERINSLGLESIIMPSPGTSEDIAMLIAYENKAELIVAVGTHSNLIDFLEKGRKGMGSTFLVRLKIGYKLIDAKGVSLLYKGSLKIKHIWWLIVSAFFPIGILIYLSQPMQHLLRVLEIRIKMMLN